jgi:hypothetical protein
MPPRAMTQQQRALPATMQGAFVTPTTSLGSYNVAHALQAGKRPMGTVKDGGR